MELGEGREVDGPSVGAGLDTSALLLVPALLFWLVAKWLFTTGRYFGQDEIESMHQGWLLYSGALQFKDFNSNHPPLFFEILGLLNWVTSDPVRLLDLGRLLTFFSSGAQLALLYVISRAVHGASAARWTVVVYATCATYLEASTEIRTDALMLPLFFGALWLLLGCQEVNAKWRLFGMGLLMGTAFWANQKIVYQALPMGLFLLLGGPTRAWRVRDLWVATAGALIPASVCLGVAWYAGNLAELFQHNFGGAAALVASDPYQSNRLQTLVRLPIRDAGFLVLSFVAIAWSCLRFRSLTRAGRYALAAAIWAVVTFFLTPGPFPYYFLGVFSLLAVVVGGFAARVEWPRRYRTWVLAGAIVLYAITPAMRVWKFHEPTNVLQRQIIRMGTALTDDDTPVFDGAGTLIRRPDAYGFHWILWVPELQRQRTGHLPPLVETVRAGGARLVIWNYRVGNLHPPDLNALLSAFPPLWGPLRVPGFDSLDRLVWSEPMAFDLWYDGFYEVSPIYARIDGRGVHSPVWLESGRHTVSVPGGAQRVIVRDAAYRERLTLPPEPADWRFFGRYGYYF